VRGLAHPVKAWRAITECPVEGRFETRRVAGLTPLAGREREIALLLDRWGLAKGGEGQVVLLTGEAGIGKSRITEAMRERLSGEEHAFLRFQCSPQRVGSALHPIIAQLQHAAHIRREDESSAKLDKLEALLARETRSASAPLFAALLGLPINGRYPPLALTPQQQKAKTLEALVGYIEAMAARRPVLLVFEDLHWIDPTSLDFLEMLVDRLARWPVLAVLTFRPEFAQPWTGRAHVTLLGLNRLGRRDAATLAMQVGGYKALPAEVMDQILDRTDGIPLFLEELTKAVLESGLLKKEAERCLLRGPLPALAIPTTLHDSLMARLDRLAPVKEVAQLAACIGREFSHDILAAVSPLAEDALTTALNQLAASELIHRSGVPAAPSYTFRHALVQEAAYQSLLKSKRQELHGRIARTVARMFPEVADLQPEWLAHHYMEAGLVEPAADHWLKAAHRAKAAYALSEAASQLARCLGVLASQAAEGQQLTGFPYLEREREALVMLGDVASLTGDLDAANRHYQRAVELAPDADTRAWIENKQHRPHTISRAGARIAFYEHGSGPNTLIIVAPLAYGLAAIQPVLERLCQEFRIITVDPRGSGASDPLTRPYPLDEHLQDVHAIISTLGDRPVIGVGISRFGNLLLKLAHAEPQLFEKLIILGTPPGDNSEAFFPAWYIDLVRTGRETRDLESLIRSHTELVYSEPEMRELQEQTIRSRLLLPPETILSFFDPDPKIDLIMLILAEIQVPTLVIHGREDRLVAFTAAEEFLARLPNARLYAVEGKGHLPIFTATDEFCEVLRSFVLADNSDAANGH
jgi:pimeloyl-ACP methyl ester carboxylesterase